MPTFAKLTQLLGQHEGRVALKIGVAFFVLHDIVLILLPFFARVPVLDRIAIDFILVLHIPFYENDRAGVEWMDLQAFRKPKHTYSVTPALAGDQGLRENTLAFDWIPACAGMTLK